MHDVRSPLPTGIPRELEGSAIDDQSKLAETRVANSARGPHRLFDSEAVTAIEYSLLIALIVVAIVAGAGLVGDQVGLMYDKIAASFP